MFFHKPAVRECRFLNSFPADRIDAVLLASGFSRRFGADDKLLARFRGKALARHTLDLVCGLNAGPLRPFRRIFFVAAGDAVKALAAGLPVTVIHNSAPEKGRRESVRLGVAAGGAGPEGPDYYLFFPCDQPLLDEETVFRVLEARRPGCIVEPRFNGNPGNPCLFASVFREELLSLGPGERPGGIKARHAGALIPAELEDGAPLMDIDDPAALENMRGGGPRNLPGSPFIISLL